jgi:alkylated DNA repair dioxygenase AlkB
MPFQPSLFSTIKKEHISLPNADIVYVPQWLSSVDISMDYSTLYHTLRQLVVWEQSTIYMYDKPMLIPRLNAWYGDEGCGYTYSGAYFEPLPWLPVLLNIKQAVEATLCDELEGVRFNSALVNCYRDGQDSVAWHSDDEPELGDKPLVASVSMGAERIFELRHKQSANNKKQAIMLKDGDLLLMAGTMQHYWQHQIPKSTTVTSERISITFRYVLRKNT